MSIAPITVTFFHFNLAAEPALRELLTERGYRARFSEPVGAQLWLRERYGAHADIATTPALLEVIIGIDPEATVEITTSPTSELRGGYTVRDPALGVFHADVDDQGHPLLRVAELVSAVELARDRVGVGFGVGVDRVFTGLDRAVGGPWRRRLRQLTDHHRLDRPEGRAPSPATDPERTPR